MPSSANQTTSSAARGTAALRPPLHHISMCVSKSLYYRSSVTHFHIKLLNPDMPGKNVKLEQDMLLTPDEPIQDKGCYSVQFRELQRGHSETGETSSGTKISNLSSKSPMCAIPPQGLLRKSLAKYPRLHSASFCIGTHITRLKTGNSSY